jgi:uncharacterized ferredoxin-like protein
MVFESVATSKQESVESIADHIDALENEKPVELVSRDEDEVEKMKDPHPDIEEGFSKVIEVNAEIEGIDSAIRIINDYGPTYIQVTGPDTLEVSLEQSQKALQKVASTMQQYAQMGAGGVLMSSPEDQS